MLKKSLALHTDQGMEQAWGASSDKAEVWSLPGVRSRVSSTWLCSSDCRTSCPSCSVLLQLEYNIIILLFLNQLRQSNMWRKTNKRERYHRYTWGQNLKYFSWLSLSISGGPHVPKKKRKKEIRWSIWKVTNLDFKKALPIAIPCGFKNKLHFNRGTNKPQVSWTTGSLVLTLHMEVTCHQLKQGSCHPRWEFFCHL